LTTELHYDVKVVKVTSGDEVKGYYPGIFGPGWYGPGGYSLQCPALDHLDTVFRDPLDDLFPTPEAAMEAWERSTPVGMSRGNGMRYFLRTENVEAINACEVFRHFSTDPDPDLWNLDNVEEIET